MLNICNAIAWKTFQFILLRCSSSPSTKWCDARFPKNDEFVFAFLSHFHSFFFVWEKRSIVFVSKRCEFSSTKVRNSRGNHLESTSKWQRATDENVILAAHISLDSIDLIAGALLLRNATILNVSTSANSHLLVFNVWLWIKLPSEHRTDWEMIQCVCVHDDQCHFVSSVAYNFNRINGRNCVDSLN